MKIELYRHSLKYGSYWLAPHWALQCLEKIIEARDEMFGLIEYSSLNQKMKDRLLHIVMELDNLVRSANDAARFDETVERAMFNRAGVEEDSLLLGSDEQKKLSKEYQLAVERYISSFIGKRKIQ